jgi:hypothetical protein
MSSYSNITINTNINLNFYVGQLVQLVNDFIYNNNYIYGQVLSYDANTGVMVIEPSSFVGSGNFDNWYLVPSGPSGEATSFQGSSNNSISLPLTPLDQYFILVNPSGNALQGENLDNLQIQH